MKTYGGVWQWCSNVVTSSFAGNGPFFIECPKVLVFDCIGIASADIEYTMNANCSSCTSSGRITLTLDVWSCDDCDRCNTTFIVVCCCSESPCATYILYLLYCHLAAYVQEELRCHCRWWFFYSNDSFVVRWWPDSRQHKVTRGSFGIFVR